MQKIDIAGLKINPLDKQELLSLILERIQTNQKTWVTTAYSEFLHAALRDPKIMELLNRAEIAVADGVGVVWARKFLSMPLTAKNYWLKTLQACWQALRTLIILPFRRHQTIPGSELIWDIARLAAENGLSIYLLGGFGDTPRIVSENLIKKITSSKNNGRYFLRIAGYSNKNPSDDSVIQDIQKTKPDILFVAYGPIKQEKWIFEHRGELPAKLLMGVGGTFDYIAGKRLNPPRGMRKTGMEWLWRLFTQPHRLKRIYNATFGLIKMMIRYKVFMSYPLRENVVAVILNPDDQILIAKKKPTHFKIDILSDSNAVKRGNYWQLPQGGTDGEINLEKAARREIKEELDINDLAFLSASKRRNEYIWSNGLRKLFFNRNYRNKGQRQTPVYFRFVGKADEIRLPANEEFSECKWVEADALDAIVHTERLPLIKIVQNDLKEMREKGII